MIRRYVSLSLLLPAILAIYLIGAPASRAEKWYTPRILYHNGAVEYHPHVYVILWGSNWSSEPGLTVRPTLEHLYTEITSASSPWYTILTQYFGTPTGTASAPIGTASAPTFYVDQETSPHSYPDVPAEVERAIAHNGWAPSETNAQFAVLFAPGTFTGATEPWFEGCGYHGHFHYEAQGIELAYNFDPYKGDTPYQRCIGIGGNATDATTFSASHEFAETVLNPFQPVEKKPYIGGWVENSSDEEIADICNIGAELKGTYKSWVTELWDNYEGKCLMEDAAPVGLRAETESALEVTSHNATPAGTANPGGFPTTYYFEYGTSETYGSRVPEEPASLGSGTTNVKVTRELASLEPNTTYHFRLVAANESGTFYGADKQFKTPAAPPAVVTGAAEGVTEDSAVMTGEVNPENSNTEYWFEYSNPAPLAPWRTTASTGIGSGYVSHHEIYQLHCRVRATKYSFRLVARNSAGTSYGSYNTFTTTNHQSELCYWNTTKGRLESKSEVKLEGPLRLDFALMPEVECNLEGTLVVYPGVVGELTSLVYNVKSCTLPTKACKVAHAKAKVPAGVELVPGSEADIPELTVEVELEGTECTLGGFVLTAHMFVRLIPNNGKSITSFKVNGEQFPAYRLTGSLTVVPGNWLSIVS
jgi:hypothetical protein